MSQIVRKNYVVFLDLFLSLQIVGENMLYLLYPAIWEDIRKAPLNSNPPPWLRPHDRGQWQRYVRQPLPQAVPQPVPTVPRPVGLPVAPVTANPAQLRQALHLGWARGGVDRMGVSESGFAKHVAITLWVCFFSINPKEDKGNIRKWWWFKVFLVMFQRDRCRQISNLIRGLSTIASYIKRLSFVGYLAMVEGIQKRSISKLICGRQQIAAQGFVFLYAVEVRSHPFWHAIDHYTCKQGTYRLLEMVWWDTRIVDLKPFIFSENSSVSTFPKWQQIQVVSWPKLDGWTAKKLVPAYLLWLDLWICSNGQQVA